MDRRMDYTSLVRCWACNETGTNPWVCEACGYSRSGDACGVIVWYAGEDGYPPDPELDMDDMMMLWNAQNAEVYSRATGVRVCVKVDSETKRETDKEEEEEGCPDAKEEMRCRWCGLVECDSGKNCELRVKFT